MDKYYSVIRSNSDDLEHRNFKYVKRVKGKNGKWRYYYDTASLKKDIKDKLGVDERQAREQAHSKLLGTNDPEATLKEREWRLEQFSKATDEYLKTPLGKIEIASEHAASGARYVAWLLRGKKK